MMNSYKTGAEIAYIPRPKGSHEPKTRIPRKSKESQRPSVVDLERRRCLFNEAAKGILIGFGVVAFLYLFGLAACTFGFAS